MPTSELTSLNYTAPTCSLEVMGELSPLSRVAEKPILKRLRFELQIRTGAGDLVVEVRGMRSHLLALANTVQTYVQNYLNTPSDSPELPSPTSTEGISLQPESLTRQTLQLGSLAPRSGPQQVPLNTLQLADLADVLDQLEAAVAILPADALPAQFQERRRPLSLSRRYAWAGSAAAVLLVVVGASTILPSVLNQSRVSQTATSSTPDLPDAETGVSSQAGGASGNLPTQVPAAKTSEPLPTESPQPTAEAPPAIATQPNLATPLPSSGGSTQGLGSNPPNTPNKIQSPIIQPTPPVRSPQPQESSPDNALSPNSQASNSQAASKIPEETPTAPPSQTLEQSPAALSAPVPEGGSAANAQADSGAGASSRIADAPAATDLLQSIEVLRARLQQQWTPPGDLRVPLTYVLVIDPTGTLQSVIPQDDAARAYRDRIPPLTPGTPLTPAQETRQSLRLTLFPSGTITLAPIINSEPQP
ncbi:MAG TPA: DUF4335 domain-containing protein [Leptolyngbyaceae cyanobacterium]